MFVQTLKMLEPTLKKFVKIWQNICTNIRNVSKILKMFSKTFPMFVQTCNLIVQTFLMFVKSFLMFVETRLNYYYVTARLDLLLWLGIVIGGQDWGLGLGIRIGD